jgi:hypothetical protein
VGDEKLLRRTCVPVTTTCSTGSAMVWGDAVVGDVGVGALA